MWMRKRNIKMALEKEAKLFEYIVVNEIILKIDKTMHKQWDWNLRVIRI